MDNQGNRFKSENEASPEIAEAATELSSDADRKKAARVKDRQSKKVERMLAKKSRHLKKDADASVDDETPADELTVDDDEPQERDSSQTELVTDAAADPEPDEPDDDVEADRRKPRRFKEDERLKEKNTKRLEKLMKKQRRRESKSDREVLSYEEMPLEERETLKKKSKVKLKRKRIILAGVIVLVLIAAVFLFTNSDRLSLHNITNFIRYGIFNMDSDQRFPVQIRDENVSAGNFCRMGQDLCYASGTKIQTLNNYGKRMLTLQHGYTKPILVCSDKYSLLYNLGGTDFQINSADGHVYSGSADSNILVVDIINNGTYALVTQSDGYLSKLYVYNSDNEMIFAYSFSEYYITSVSLKSNGKMAVLSGVSAHNGSEISSLYVLDFTKDSPLWFSEIEDTVIYDVQYLGSTYAAAVGSNGAYVIDTGDGDINRTDYEGRQLTAYTFNTDTDTFSLSLSRSGDGRNCDIWSFGTNGSLSDSFSTDLRVISLSSYKNRVALLTTDTIYLYNKGGDLVESSASGIDPRCVVMYTSSDVYVLDTSEIRSVSM